jgi:hypothetical protein
MTVQELIKRLSELPPHATAMVRDIEGRLARVDDADVMAPQYGDWMQGVRERVYITGNY